MNNRFNDKEQTGYSSSPSDTQYSYPPSYGNTGDSLNNSQPPKQEYITPPQNLSSSDQTVGNPPESPNLMDSAGSYGPSKDSPSQDMQFNGSFESNPYSENTQFNGSSEANTYSQNAQFNNTPEANTYSQNAQFNSAPEANTYSQNAQFNSAPETNTYSQNTQFNNAPEADPYSQNMQFNGSPESNPYSQNMASGNAQQENPYAGGPYAYTPNSNTTQAVTPKRSHKWLWGLTAIPALAIVAILAFCFIPSFKTFVFRNVLGSTKYYEYVESSCSEQIGDLFDGIDLTSSTSAAKDGMISSNSLSFNLNSAIIDQLGFDLNKVTCDITSTSKDNQGSSNYVIKYDGKQIVTLDMYADTETSKLYFRIPELNEKYLDFTELLSSYYAQEASSVFPSGLLNLSTSSQSGSIQNCTSLDKDTTSEIVKKLQESLDPETVQELLVDYIQYVLDDLGDKGAIKLSKSTDYTINGTTEKCDKFTISITEAQLKEVVLDVLKKAKDDKKIQDIATKVTGISSLYTAALETAISQFNEVSASDSNDPVLMMSVYTNGKAIIGRSFSFDIDNHSLLFDYGMISTDSKLAATASITTEKDTLASITLDADKNKDSYTGNLILSASGENLTLEYENYKITKDNNLEGSFKFTAGGSTITAEFTPADGKQTLTLGGNFDGTDYGSCSISYNNTKDSSASVSPVPESDVITINSKEDFAQYLENSQLESFIQNLMTTFNVPSTVSAKDLATLLISNIRSGSNFEPETTPAPDNSDSNSTYKPEDYNLPSGAEINEDGDYSYDLSEQELNALKAQGSDSPTFAKTTEDLSSYMNSLGKTICGSDFRSDTLEINNVSGNIKDNQQTISHFGDMRWYSDNGSIYDYVSMSYDTLNNKVRTITVSTTKKENVFSSLTGCYKALGVTGPSSDLLKSIQDSLNKDQILDVSESFSDSDLYLRSEVESDGSTQYYFSISAIRAN